MSELRPARVRVPCSTSNLGSGYDTIGLALDRYLDVSFDPSGARDLRVERTGTLAWLDAAGERDLAAEAFASQLALRGIQPRGVLRLESEIPVARGLGASATAVLAGYDLARAASGEDRDDEGAFRAALRYEGHGDNAAPCLYGGLRAVASTPAGPVAIRLMLSESVGFAYAAPAVRIDTKEAREMLPSRVPHGMAAAALGHLVALVRGLAEADPDLIRIGVRDELHVPHRLPLIPKGTEAITAAIDAGAWAVTISGSGSGLIAMCAPDAASAIAAAMRDVFLGGGDGEECVGFAARPDMEGLRRL